MKKLQYLLLIAIPVAFISLKRKPERKAENPIENIIIEPKIYVTLDEKNIKLEMSAKSARNEEKNIYLYDVVATVENTTDSITWKASAAEFNQENKTLKILNGFVMELQNEVKVSGNEVTFHDKTLSSNSKIKVEFDNSYLVAESMVLNISEMSAKFYKPLLKIQ